MQTHPLVVPVLVASLGGYLLGSIPVAVLIGKARGVDPRDVGDHNPGYWNSRQQLGRAAAVPVLLGDGIKGTVAAAVGTVAGHLAGVDGHGILAATWAAAAAAMIGHAWPVFAGFRGGRSILTYCGALAVLSPRTFAISLAACLVVTGVVRSFTWGARVGVFGTAAVSFVIDGRYRTAALGILMTLIGLRFALAAIAARRRGAADQHNGADVERPSPSNAGE